MKRTLKSVLSIAAGVAVGIILLPLTHEFLWRIQLLVSARTSLYLTALRSAVAAGSVLNGMVLGLLPGFFASSRKAWLQGAFAALLVVIIYHLYLTTGPSPYIWGRNYRFDQLLILGYAGLLAGASLGAQLTAKFSRKE